MPDKLLNLKLDIVFQELFGNPKNAEITGHWLSLILKQEIYNVDIKNDELAHWLMFINNPDSEEVEKFMCENKFWKQAREELAYLNGEENFQFLVDDRAMYLMDQDAREKKGFADGKAEGLSEGLADGENKKQTEIAKKMKSKNIPIDEISELTGLSKEEIKKL